MKGVSIPHFSFSDQLWGNPAFHSIGTRSSFT